jgi:2-methylcitrate dehydratase PrpD
MRYERSDESNGWSNPREGSRHALDAEEDLEVEEFVTDKLAAYAAGLKLEHIAPEAGVEEYDPRTRETADPSLPYCLAAALVDRALTKASLDAIDRLEALDSVDELADACRLP